MFHADSVFINGGGVVIAYAELASGQRHVAGFRFHADLFGLAEHGRYVNTTRAVTPVTIFRLPVSELTPILQHDAGLEFHIKSVDLTDGVGIFLQTRAAWAGGTSKFGSLLGVDNGKNNFGYSTLSTGFSFGGRYLITASRTLSGPRTLRDLGWQVGLTALRGPAS